MKILFPLENIQVLSGASRVLLAVADLCKVLGHEVEVWGDRDAADPGPDPTAKVMKHYEPEHIGEYYPLKALVAEDVHMGRLFNPDMWTRYQEADLVWTFNAMMDRIEDHCEKDDPNLLPDLYKLKNHWSYQHWPVERDYPHPSCVLHANSEYTRAEVKRRWGRPCRLLHPPLPLDAYNPTPTYDERDIDLIYIGRVDPLKLGNPPALNRFKDLKTLIVGADNEASFPDYKPDVTWVKNATFQELAANLSQTKVYVHWKGLLNPRDAEHLGIVCVEAMASGIPTIVPKVGGPWTDISLKGRYAMGVGSVNEAMGMVSALLDDQDLWHEWSSKALLGVQRFSYSTARAKILLWLNELEGCIQGNLDE